MQGLNATRSLLFLLLLPLLLPPPLLPPPLLPLLLPPPLLLLQLLRCSGGCALGHASVSRHA